MICTTKDDVVLWFKELESYKRIDTMCTLLNMCLPFELRFLGTCLEELGRRDSQELRGIELRVNNASELAADVASCRQGEPTDLKIRRKMALYLALIRSCSRSCVVDLFHTLDGWGDRDFLRFGEHPSDESGAAASSAASDPLQELLLVYTMAANHPVFSFEQRMKCGQIYTKISDCNQRLIGAGQEAGRPSSNLSSGGSMTHLATPPPMQSQSSAGHGAHSGLSQMHQVSMVPAEPHQMQHGIITHIPIGFVATPPNAQIITTTSDPNAMSVEGITQIMPHSLSMQADFVTNTTNATSRMQHPPSWSIRHGQMHSSYPPPSIEPMSLPAIPASMSPLSEPSSPVQSRTASPSRQPPQIQQQHLSQQTHQHQQPHPHHQQSHHSHSLQMHHRATATQRSASNVVPNRRPSDDRTSPPQQQQQHGMMGSEGQNTKICDETVLNVDGALTQLQSIHRNGYSRTTMHHTLPRLNKHNSYLQQQHHHYHMQQQQQHQHHQQQQLLQHHHQQHQQQQQHLHQQNASSQYTTGNSLHVGYTAMPKSQQQHLQLIEGGASHYMDHSTELRHKSAESDSSSVSDTSPPETPTLQAAAHQNLNHMHSQPSNATGRVVLTSGKDLYGSGVSKQYARHNGGRSSSSGAGANVSGTNTFNHDKQSTATMLPPLSTAPPQLISTASQVGSTANIMHIHQFPPPNAAHPLNANYPTQYGQPPHMVSSGRGAILSQPPPSSNQTASQSQHHLYRTTHPPTYTMQQTSNGEIMYTSFPPQQHTPPSLPYHIGAASNVTSIISPAVRLSPSIQQQVSSLPATHPASSLLLDPSLAAAAPSNPKQIQSCFNCGSQSHTGRECKEASMEDVTRNSIYKLDYSAAQALADMQNATANAATNSSISASSAASSHLSPFNTSIGPSGEAQALISENVAITTASVVSPLSSN